MDQRLACSSDGTRARSVRSSRRDSYEVVLRRRLLDPADDTLPTAIGSRRTLIVTTPTVNRLYARRLRENLKQRGIHTALLEVPGSEATKGIDQVLPICEAAERFRLGREGLLIAIGGGICSDLVTLAASWIRRGVRYLRVPTTLVGQIDAAIGIKGGINFEGKKSYIGCFFAPTRVLVDPEFLATLPPTQLRNGVSEMIKIAVCRDPRLFDQIERYGPDQIDGRFQHDPPVARKMLWRAICGMLDELEPNLYEDQTYERPVDFGHTFSPLIESKAGWTIHHGEAVAIDMALSTALAVELGRLDEPTCDRIITLIQRIGLPVGSSLIDVRLCRDALNAAALHRGGSPNLVVPERVGRIGFVRRIADVPDSILAAALERLDGFEDLEARSANAR